MSSLLERLSSFERKERFAVLREAMGFNPNKIQLEERFRQNLSESIDLSIPSQVFLAMDYHLDWIEIALHLHNSKSSLGSRFPYDRASEINSNQQDIDLMIAFEDKDETGNTKSHLVLIEAKAFSSWNNKQLISKASRLEEIFRSDGKRYPSVEPHFVLMTGRNIENVETEKWPKFMRNGDTFRILKYSLPERLKITRCDDNGKNNSKGTHLRLDLERLRS